MKNLKLFSILAAFAAFMVIGCSKNGTTGPAGPAGDANVLHSAWITLAMTQEVDNNNDTSYYQAVTASALTSTILDSGVVLSYIGLLPTLTGLTDTLVINSADIYTYTGYYLTQDLAPQQIELYAGTDFSGQLYRYVLIPGSVLTNSAFKQYTKAQIKTMSYSSVQKLLSTSVISTSPN